VLKAANTNLAKDETMCQPATEHVDATLTTCQKCLDLQSELDRIAESNNIGERETITTNQAEIARINDINTKTKERLSHHTKTIDELQVQASVSSEKIQELEEALKDGLSQNPGKLLSNNGF
jgi:hypothetical protein